MARKPASKTGTKSLTKPRLQREVRRLERCLSRARQDLDNCSRNYTHQCQERLKAKEALARVQTQLEQAVKRRDDANRRLMILKEWLLPVFSVFGEPGATSQWSPDERDAMRTPYPVDAAGADMEDD